MASDVGKGFLQSISDGGAIQLLIGRHAADAIGLLIYGVADIGLAHLKRVSQPVHDRVEAASMMRMRLAAAAADRAVDDPALVDRTLQRLAGAEIGRQERRETVARLTVDDLSSEPPNVEAAVSDEFMGRFEQLAETATTPEMQALFAKVLAGEIRKPGAFSLATLHVLSLMDQPLANQLQRASTWVFSDAGIPADVPFTGGEMGAVIGDLIDLGLLRAAQMNQQLRATSGKVTIMTRDRLFVLSLGIAGPGTSFPYWLLTRTGREVMSVVPQTPVSAEDLRALHKAWGMSSHVARVQSGPLMNDPDSGRPATPIDQLVEF